MIVLYTYHTQMSYCLWAIVYRNDCIVLNKFYDILFRRYFNSKFKKQGDNLKHYEGENIVKIANEAIIYVFILICNLSGHDD